MSPVEWSPCCPRTIHLPLTASPCGRLSRPPSTISQYDFHSVVRPSSPWRLVGPYKLSFEPDGSPLFTSTPLVACWRYEPREHLRPLAKTRPLIPPSPLSDRVGYSDHVRFRGYFPVHCIPAYHLPVYASQWPLPEHHARLGTRLLARLYRGRHRRRQTSTRLQGATLIGRVEGWRAGVAVSTHTTSPAPSTSHATCGFPALRAPICFTPKLMGPILPGRLSARRVALDRR